MKQITVTYSYLDHKCKYYIFHIIFCTLETMEIFFIKLFYKSIRIWNSDLKSIHLIRKWAGDKH